jgi:hypothetical protein
MPGHFEVGDVPILRDHFWSNSPSVGNAFLEVVVIPHEHSCIFTSGFGVGISPQRCVPCYSVVTGPLEKVYLLGLLPSDQGDQDE